MTTVVTGEAPVYTVQTIEDPAPTIVQILGTGPQGPPGADGEDGTGGGGSFTPPDAAEAVRYVSGTGVDTDDGLSASFPKRTLQSAYSSLPSTGGTVVVAPGRYDVGAGWNLTRGKPVWFLGSVRPPRTIGSSTTVPLTHNCAIIYSSTGAAEFITTTAGTAATNFDGLRFENLLFEISHPNTTAALSLTSCRYFQVVGNYCFADKTTGPAHVDAKLLFARGVNGYGDADSSWSRIDDNQIMNCALATLGNPTGTKYNSNQHVVTRNVGLGRTRLDQTQAPFLTQYGCHRNTVRDNNIEAYYRGILMDTCWMCSEDGDGGEVVDIFIDMVNSKGNKVAPLGCTYGPNGSYSPLIPGALLVRGDAFTKANIITLPSTWDTANTQRLYPPIGDATHPSVSLGSTDNRVISGEGFWSDGSFLTSGGGGGGSDVVSRYLVSSDQTINSQTVLQDVTSLAHTVLGNSADRYFVEFVLMLVAANTTMDVKVAIIGPSGTVVRWGYRNHANTALPGLGPQSTGGSPLAAAGSGTAAAAGSLAGSSEFLLEGAGIAIGGATVGDLKVQFAQNTSDAGNLTIKTGSFMRVTRLA